MTAPRDMESICVTLESLLRLAKSEIEDARATARSLNDDREREQRLRDAAQAENDDLVSSNLSIRESFVEHGRKMDKFAESARAVLSLRKADDVAFRAAVTVLVTDILGAGCWDSSNKETETMP